MARRGDGLWLRGKTWWLDFTHQGKRHQERLGRNISRQAAGELAAVKRAAVLKGEAGIGRKRKDLPFEKAKEKFLAWAEANRRPNTMASYRQSLAQLGRVFGGKSLGQILPFALEHYKRARLEAGAKVGVNRELTALKALYNRCAEWKLYEGENPVRRVKLLAEPKGRLRFLSDEEEATLLAAAGDPLRTILLVGLHAGLRIRAEALTLRWPAVDLRRGLLTVESAYAKSGKTRTVEMNSTLRGALAAHRERNGAGEYLFHGRGGKPYRDVRTAFENARDRAGLGKDVTPHTLRHTWASRLVMAGVDLRTVQELGGWASLDQVQRYSHLAASHKREAVERIARRAIVSEVPPTVFSTRAQAEVAAG